MAPVAHPAPRGGHPPAAEGDGLVLGCAERAGRLDVAWSELAARRCIRSSYEPRHLSSLQHAVRRATLATHSGQCSGAAAAASSPYRRAHADPVPSPRLLPRPTPPDSGAHARVSELEKLVAELRGRVAEQDETIEHLRFCASSEVVATVSELAGGAVPGSAVTPGELAFAAAQDLGKLPRSKSQESISGDQGLLDWRAELDMREQAVLLKEMACDKREKRIADREKAVGDVEVLKSNLEQELKETQIKHREFMFKFRFLEETEAQQGTLPDRMREVREQENDLLEREEALQNREEQLTQRESEVEAMHAQRTRELDEREAELQEREEAAAPRPPGPPDTLVLDAAPRPELQGEYTRASREFRGRPMWEMDDKRVFAEGGIWMVGSEEEMEEGIGWIFSAAPHGGKLPHEIAKWLYVPEADAEPIPSDDIVFQA
eukprot:TRINITY_DN15595_c0_g1_i1.p1 TRINITY_DN15595_c0_g1~~TRINITY_DN15595_c0_g1_i1.p1  ORF type:complete len:434 (+),score=141.44 TRINITY_DN15595_c0_g1_i1:48-1349(+)